MNEIVNTLLLARDKFMPEVHLKQVLVVYLLKTKNSKIYAD